MSDIPLRALKKGRNYRQGYEALRGDEEAERDAKPAEHRNTRYNGNGSSSTRPMASRFNTKQKGKGKQRYRDDDEEAEESLLGRDEYDAIEEVDGGEEEASLKRDSSVGLVGISQTLVIRL